MPSCVGSVRHIWWLNRRQNNGTRTKKGQSMSLQFFRQFRELALGVCFGISMLAGAAIGGYGAVLIAMLLGYEPTETTFIGGICGGVVIGGRYWKLVRFVATAMIAANQPGQTKGSGLSIERDLRLQ